MPRQILLCENTIIAIDDNHDFIIWDIPEQLPPAVPQQALPSVVNGPKRIRRQHESDLPGFNVATTPSWQRHTPPYISFIVDEDDDANYENRVWLHSLRKLGTHDKAFVPTYLPVDVGECASLAEDIGAEIQSAMTPLIFCDGRLVLCSRTTSNEVVATVFPIPTTQAFDDTIDPRSAYLLQEVDQNEVSLDYDNVAFCPMSGRLVWPISDTSLQISDFLLPLDDRERHTV